VGFGTVRLATAALALVSAAAIVLLLYCMALEDSGGERGQKTVHLFAFKS
jgi:hypothetical protein